MGLQIVLATNNLHKVREFKGMLKSFPSIKSLDILSLKDFPQYIAPPETGSTFRENCLIKGESAAKALGKLVLADDSGLIVPALQGRPGVHSAHYAGMQATDKDNRQKLLKEMKDLHGNGRDAYFECYLALISPERVLKECSAVCEGTIIDAEKGGGGFGYDPLFLKHDYRKTFAELDETVKNQVSHRRKALEKLIPYLEQLLKEYQ